MNHPGFWISLALRSLNRNRRRALAMMAGIAAGIALLTTVNAVGAAARRLTLAQVKNMLGTFDTVLVRPGAAKTRGMVSLANVPPTLTFDDAAALAQLPAVAQVAELQNAFDIDVEYRDRQVTPAVFGVSANWLDLRGDAVAAGRFFSAAEMQGESRVAVVGADVVAGLFAGANPLSATLRLGGNPYRVVGVLAPRGAGPGGFSLDNLILIPLSTARHRLFNRDFLTMVVAQVRPGTVNSAALAQVRQSLRQRHHIAAAALDDFSLTDPSAVAAQVTAAGSRLRLLLRGVAYVLLALGAVAIVALMLLGVIERRTEIAIRRAAGASRADILAQFLAEAAVLSALAALAGALLGVAGMTLTARWQHLPLVWDWPALAGLGLSAVALGLLCGLLPALRAARLEPAAALRS
ncbi:MAG TPA: ABC transporter permease [Terriglobales bacterium]|nr:ABC transporter permease [Terriglobales bacterium]